ncbi:MAG: hypothetical protein ABIP48_16500 [Planctomycetota bacterium]
MAHEIAELKRLVGQAELTKSDVGFLMSRVRSLLEERGLQSKYGVLNLYCNWTVHPKIDRSMVCFRMLERLTDNILKHKDSPPDSPFFAAVTETLAVPQLRDQFIGFCREFSVPDTFCRDADIWKRFFSMLASILIDTPIQFPDVRSMKPNSREKAIYDSIQAKAGGRSFGVKGFSFFVKETGEGHDSGELWWKVDLIPREPGIARSMSLTGKVSWIR